MDGDDMYLDKDVLSTITNIALKGDFDIVIFKSIFTDLKPDAYSTKITLPNLERNYKPNLVLFQHDLEYYPITLSENINKVIFNEIFIHPKCIKTKIYKEALKKLGEERFSRYMAKSEDK